MGHITIKIGPGMPRYGAQIILNGLEVVLETPVYDLTVFKLHFGELTLKADSNVVTSAHMSSKIICAPRELVMCVVTARLLPDAFFGFDAVVGGQWRS